MQRIDGRRPDELRPLTFTPNYVVYPEGSVLVAMGGTKVICNVTIQPGVPGWKERLGLPGGWITGEYGLLPRATHQRTLRETNGLRARTQEIRRIIGRSLRAAVDLEHLGAQTCIIDCDVIQADGGTRTASISGGYVALALALDRLVRRGEISSSVFLSPVAAVSVGLVDQTPMLDLSYEEDVRAEVDFNIVMNSERKFIEVQGNAEGAPFSRGQLDDLLALAGGGIETILALQQQVISQDTHE